MRRRHAHLAFGLVALGCGTLAGYQGVRLHEAQQVNAAIRAADSQADSALPEARFARAASLAKQGNYPGALKAYQQLSVGDRADLATAALYNTGNLHLEEALKGGPSSITRAFPLIELAKQSYRAVLRRDPQSWDARYNLERALWLAPELEDATVQRLQRNAEDRVMSTLQSTRGELP